MPSFRITHNSEKVADISLQGPGVLHTIVGWNASEHPEAGPPHFNFNIGGLESTTNELTDWSAPELKVGDKILIEISDHLEASPAPQRRPLELPQDLEKKKDYVRQCASELGWEIVEIPDSTG